MSFAAVTTNSVKQVTHQSTRLNLSKTMATCLAILSPAKSLIETAPTQKLKLSKPALTHRQLELLEECQSLSKSQLKSLMGLSDSLASLNYDRFQQFDTLPILPACYAFNGPAHAALDISSLDQDSHHYAERSIITLSGLYGCLRPLDEMKPYRLEMGTKLPNKYGKNLYEFWGEDIAQQLLNMIGHADAEDTFIVNVASEEYWSSVKKHVSTVLKDIPIYTIKFPGPSVYAKQARGLFCRFMCQKQVSKAQELDNFEDWCNEQTHTDFTYSLSSKDAKNKILTFSRSASKSAGSKSTKRTATASKGLEKVTNKKSKK